MMKTPGTHRTEATARRVSSTERTEADIGRANGKDYVAARGEMAPCCAAVVAGHYQTVIKKLAFAVAA